MKVSTFENQFKHLINLPVKRFNSKGYSKKYGNLSVHDGEYDLNSFYYVCIDDEVMHIACPSIPSFDKEGKKNKYGIINGSFLVSITEDYLFDRGYIESYKRLQNTKQEFVKSVEEYREYSRQLEEKYAEITDSTNVSLKIENNFKKLVELYKAKNKEYSTDTWDSNFIKGANILQQTKEETLLGYVTKHIVSVVDIIKGKPANLDTVKEKIGDIQIYMALLQIMFEEKLEK
jgi:hypothetical protein